jgi:hypothetical protein
LYSVWNAICLFTRAHSRIGNVGKPRMESRILGNSDVRFGGGLTDCPTGTARYLPYSCKDLATTVHTIIRRTISQYDVNQAVKLGVDRKTAQAGSIKCVQRFGGSINLMMPSYYPSFLSD